jgi:two-component system nitrate/nitrite response regulator NarP
MIGSKSAVAGADFLLTLFFGPLAKARFIHMCELTEWSFSAAACRMSGRALEASRTEVALLVARGVANKEIAHELGLSLGTVKLHVHSIFLKLGTRGRNMLVLLARGRAVA